MNLHNERNQRFIIAYKSIWKVEHFSVFSRVFKEISTIIYNECPLTSIILMGKELHLGLLQN